jgi:acyl-coenzyme A thioesterase PaaI-like protein
VNIADLPFNRLIGIAPSQKEGCVLSLPNDVRYTNHLGTVHACALIALAEATSGDYLIKESAGVEFEVIAVVRRLEARFRKPAFGAVHSTITVPTEKKKEFLSILAEKGRALFEHKVDVYDEKGSHALVAMIEWFVARKE